jgi:tetratricopeptide (TPR) repeat protein
MKARHFSEASAPPAPESSSALPDPALPVTPPSASGSPGKRKRGLRWLGVSGALALGVGIVWAIWFFWPTPLPEPPVVDSEESEVRRVIQEYHQKLVQQRRQASAWGDYGTILLAHLFDREAEECFAVASRLDPNDPRWFYGRALIALKRRPQEAVDLLRQAVEASRRQPQYQRVCEMTLAEALLERGEAEQAAELFRKYLSPPPGEPRARFGLALVAMALGHTEEAWSHLQAVREYPCCRKQAHTHLAALARTKGDLAAARQYESIASTADPDPPWPDPYLDHVVSLQVGRRGLQRRAGVLERDGRFFEAAQLYLKALQDQRTVDALLGAAVNLARLHQHGEALKLLREARELDARDASVQYTYALVLYAHAEIVQSHDPGHPQLREWFQEAAEAARLAIELKPDHGHACLFRGLALLQLGQAQEALVPLRQGLAIEPDNFELHLALGQALARCGQLAEAEKELQTAAQLRPMDPRPSLELQRLRQR